MLQARQSFTVGRRVIRKGTVLDNDDPIVKGREPLFEDPSAAQPERRIVRPHGRMRQSPPPATTPEQDETDPGEPAKKAAANRPTKKAAS